MDVILIIVFFALLAAIYGYTLTTYFSSSRTVKGGVMVAAVIASVPILGFGIYVLVSSTFDANVKMWAMGICALIAGFWLKNPFRDFAQG